MPKVLYLAPYYRPWEDVSIISPLQVEVGFKAPKGCPGVCLVFDSIEAMREVYPDVEEGNVQVFPVPEERVCKEQK